MLNWIAPEGELQRTQGSTLQLLAGRAEVAPGAYSAAMAVIWALVSAMIVSIGSVP